MKKFKLHTGRTPVYEITRNNFERLTQNKPEYQYVGKDGIRRSFAVCPACDNPIQLIGLYKRLENTDRPYGRHYNKDTDIAKHNEQAYLYCPYAGRRYVVTKDARKEELTEFEINIYNTVREYFDLAIYIAQKKSGIYISDRMAEKILRSYLASEAYMYYWATLYNIPWMLLYFSSYSPCYKIHVRNDSDLHRYLSSREDVRFVDSFKKGYSAVENNGSFLNLNYSFILHDRKVVDDEVRESLQLSISYEDKDGLPQSLVEIPLDINEYDFLNFLSRANFRNEKLRNIAKEMMPEL